MKQRRNTAFIVIAIMFLALALACGGGENTTGNGNNGGNTPTPAPATPAANPATGGTEVAAKPPTSEEAQKLFKGRCIACHGEDGKGKKDFAPNAPDFTDAAWQKTKTDEQLVKSISDGIGQGKGAMPRWKNLLKPEEIQALVTYVRTYTK